MRQRPSRSATQDGRRAAIISFDVTADGFRAVPRTHLHLIAGGLAIFLESGVPQGATILSAFAPSSFAGIASSLVIWLLSGGALVLHHPFDADVLEQQIDEQACDVLVAPAPLALRLAEAGMLSRMPALRHVIGLWRAPEQVASSAGMAGRAGRADRRLFVRRSRPVRRLPRGRWRAEPDPAGTASRASRCGGRFDHRRDSADAEGNAGAARADDSRCRLRAAAPSGNSLIAQPPLDHVDTGYAARLDRTTGALCITAPPSGIMAVGGYRFLAHDLQEWAKRLGQGALLTALPDRLSGHRLAGRAEDNARAREAFSELGLNPLMSEAFRDRATTG